MAFACGPSDNQIIFYYTHTHPLIHKTFISPGSLIADALPHTKICTRGESMRLPTSSVYAWSVAMANTDLQTHGVCSKLKSHWQAG